MIVLRSSRKIDLSEIFESLKEDTLIQSLRSLQKWVLARFVEPILNGNSSVLVDGPCLTIYPEPVSNPIRNLSVVIDFIQHRIFAFVPPAHLAKTMLGFYQTLASSLLDFFRRTMPDSRSALPTYLQVVKDAVEFESSFTHFGISTGQHQVVAEWADSVQTHYEKRRRENILEAARRILSDERGLAGARVEKDHSLDEISVDGGSIYSVPKDNTLIENGSVDGVSVDDVPADDPWDTGNDVPADDPWDAGNVPVDDPWDDGWNEDFTSDPVVEPAMSSPSKVSPPTIPKSAKGLERLSSKSRPSSGSPDVKPTPPYPTTSFQSPSTFASTASAKTDTPRFPPVTLSPEPKIKETYLVSECTKSILKLIRDTAEERRELVHSGCTP